MTDSNSNARSSKADVRFRSVLPPALLHRRLHVPDGSRSAWSSRATRATYQAVLELANRESVAVLPRGGGTSLTGQTVNRAVVMDFSRWMQNILEVNREEMWARVQPGVVQDELNAHVRPSDCSSARTLRRRTGRPSAACWANKLRRSHSIAYGLTIEHVIELTALLADGSRVVFGEVTPEAFRAKQRASGLEGQIYREVARIRDQHGALIRERYPKHWRRVCGYNLDELVKDRPLNMARLVVGSEGTLLTIVEAKIAASCRAPRPPPST